MTGSPRFARSRRRGFGHVKLKVGARLEDDIRRCGIAREAIGETVGSRSTPTRSGTCDAIAWVRELARCDRPGLRSRPTRTISSAWPRSGSGAPVRVATGEHVSNRVLFKQLLQASAIDIMQIDACRLAGVNENIANLLLAAKFGVPVCPHAGGVGLCEFVQHLAMFDYVALSGTMYGRVIEWIDHLHEHFVTPRWWPGAT